MRVGGNIPMTVLCHMLHIHPLLIKYIRKLMRMEEGSLLFHWILLTSAHKRIPWSKNTFNPLELSGLWVEKRGYILIFTPTFQQSLHTLPLQLLILPTTCSFSLFYFHGFQTDLGVGRHPCQHPYWLLVFACRSKPLLLAGVRQPTFSSQLS